MRKIIAFRILLFISIGLKSQVSFENLQSSGKAYWVCLLTIDGLTKGAIHSDSNFEPLILGEKVYTMEYYQHKYLDVRKILINESAIYNSSFKLSKTHGFTISTSENKLKFKRVINSMHAERKKTTFVFIFKVGLLKKKIEIELTEDNINNFNEIFQEAFKRKLKTAATKFSFDSNAWK